MKSRGQGSGVRGQKLTAQVREVLADLKEATKAEIAERLGVQTQADLGRVDRAVEGLAKTGEATAISLDAQGEPIPAFQPLKYRWVASLVKARGAVQAKLWEFACLRFAAGKPFGVAEAARLAECDRDYAKRYLRWLWQEGYLSLITRGRHGVAHYQVVGGREHEAAPQWNRRAEKRRFQVSGSRGQEIGQAPPLAGLPAPEEIPPGPPLPKGGELAARAARLDAIIEEFGAVLVEVAGGIGRGVDIINKVKGELLAMGGQGHDEPDGSSAGHH